MHLCMADMYCKHLDQCPTYFIAAASSSQVSAIEWNSCASLENSSPVPFLLFAFLTRDDFLVGLRAGAGFSRSVLPSTWTVLRRFPMTGEGSSSTSMGSICPIALADVVEYNLRLLGAEGTGDWCSSFTVTSRARRPVNNMICVSLSNVKLKKEGIPPLEQLFFCFQQ